MHAVGPHVHVVAVRQVTLGEGPLLGLPLRGQPGDHRRRQPRGRAEEPGQRRREVARATCRAGTSTATPRPPSGSCGTTAARSSCGTGTAPRSSSTRLSFTRGAVTSIRPGAVVIVRGSARPLRTTSRWPSLVTLAGQPGDVGVHLGLQSGGQHPPGTIEDDLIERRTHLRAGLLIGHYSQHRRSFLAGVPTPAVLVLVQRGRYVAPSNGSPIHRFRSYLSPPRPGTHRCGC